MGDAPVTPPPRTGGTGPLPTLPPAGTPVVTVPGTTATPGGTPGMGTDHAETRKRVDGAGEPVQVSFQPIAPPPAPPPADPPPPAKMEDPRMKEAMRVRTAAELNPDIIDAEKAGKTGASNFTLGYSSFHDTVPLAAVDIRTDRNGVITRGAVGFPADPTKTVPITNLYLRRDEKTGRYIITARDMGGKLRAPTEKERTLALLVISGIKQKPHPKGELDQQMAPLMPGLRNGMMSAMLHGLMQVDPKAEEPFREHTGDPP